MSYFSEGLRLKENKEKEMKEAKKEAMDTEDGKKEETAEQKTGEESEAQKEQPEQEKAEKMDVEKEDDGEEKKPDEGDEEEGSEDSSDDEDSETKGKKAKRELPSLAVIKLQRKDGAKAHINMSETTRGMFLMRDSDYSNSLVYGDCIGVYADPECTSIIGSLSSSNQQCVYVPRGECWLQFKNVDPARGTLNGNVFFIFR